MDSWPAARVPDLPGRGPETVIWDTASGGLAEAARSDVATIYACGITPYDATHIGHAATYIAWDLLIRAWRDAGHEVRYVQNVTDVDDPLLERADRDGEDWRELADREIDLYRSDMAALRVLPPDHLIGAVEALEVIDEFTGLLVERGSLYDLDGDVYFCRSADADFGSVSGLDTENMTKLAAERGGDPGRPGKKDPLDPVVWLARKEGEPSWDSRFGQGRPGWHVECAAIATKYLGEAFDVQAGGTDLIFPHHEMSASHARVALRSAVGSSAEGSSTGDGASGEAFARRYVHAGMVKLGGEKMSKSLGNLVFVSVLRESGADPMALRLAILARHYREDLDWTDELLAEAEQRLERWRAAVRAGLSGPGGVTTEPGPVGPAEAGPDEASREVLAAIRLHMANDLNAPAALAVVDAWAETMLDASPRSEVADVASSARLVRDAVDALLGVVL
ncbi:MAG: cysteine--1-D-myo-inosityl 2-amino-2-deoxy-alpha-D-glucopyranoside ligase [Nocardiopsaceae bacterium]|jgi:L-cysteine:1D-myo-inositol 2-amino-2-deoxy-alpha-D-glucopyranoside ligase|nr:cysteine--1-D-myo-inosityl 2-amino-2-deoxy-alpha-D-glucopyranoside ligase [Nocardiopsaceae bacterium]